MQPPPQYSSRWSSLSRPPANRPRPRAMSLVRDLDAIGQTVHTTWTRRARRGGAAGQGAGGTECGGEQDGAGGGERVDGGGLGGGGLRDREALDLREPTGVRARKRGMDRQDLDGSSPVSRGDEAEEQRQGQGRDERERRRRGGERGRERQGGRAGEEGGRVGGREAGAGADHVDRKERGELEYRGEEQVGAVDQPDPGRAGQHLWRSAGAR